MASYAEIPPKESHAQRICSDQHGGTALEREAGQLHPGPLDEMLAQATLANRFDDSRRTLGVEHVRTEAARSARSRMVEDRERLFVQRLEQDRCERHAGIDDDVADADAHAGHDASSLTSRISRAAVPAGCGPFSNAI